MWKYDCVIRLNTVIRIIFACVYFISIFTVGGLFLIPARREKRRMDDALMLGQRSVRRLRGDAYAAGMLGHSTVAPVDRGWRRCAARRCDEYGMAS